MILVLCMAGLYQRFRDAGYQTPKFLLAWRGRPILDHILEHTADRRVVEHVLLVANRRDAAAAPQLAALLQSQGWDPAAVHWVSDTEGQAHTAELACQEIERRWPAAGPSIAFHNIDTLLLGRDWPQIAASLAQHDGLIDVFHASHPGYSYVAVDAKQVVTDIREKVVISDLATTGFYGFADRRRFIELAAGAGRSRGERYISDVYRRLLDLGGRILAPSPRLGEQCLVFGTPTEYEALVAAG